MAGERRQSIASTDDTCIFYSPFSPAKSKIKLRVHQLLSSPFRSRVVRRVEVHDLSPFMTQNDRDIQESEGRRGNGEEVYRYRLRYMVTKESTPGLRRRRPMADHVFGDGRFGHTDAEHFQFTMDAGSTPTYVVPRHGPNQFAHIGIDSWSTTLTPARFPGPVKSKSFSMPSDQSV